MGEFPEPAIYVILVESVPGSAIPVAHVVTFSWGTPGAAMIEEVLNAAKVSQDRSAGASEA